MNLDRHGCRRSATAAASRVETEPGGIFSFCAADVLSQYYWAACRFGLGFFSLLHRTFSAALSHKEDLLIQRNAAFEKYVSPLYCYKVLPLM